MSPTGHEHRQPSDLGSGDLGLQLLSRIRNRKINHEASRSISEWCNRRWRKRG